MFNDGGYHEQALTLTCGAATLPAILTLPGQRDIPCDAATPPAAPAQPASTPPSQQPPATRGVLVIVGGPQYRAGSHRQFTLLARSLAAQGIPVMRFDARGMGDGEGGQRTFEDLAEDVRAATDCFMRAVPGLRDVVLWGLCDGAAAAVLHGGSDERISGLVLLNPWARDEAGLAKAMLKHYYLRRLADPALWRKVFSGRFDVRASAASLAALIGQALRPASRPPVAGVGHADAASTLVAGADPVPDAMSTAPAPTPSAPTVAKPFIPVAAAPSAPAVAKASMPVAAAPSAPAVAKASMPVAATPSAPAVAKSSMPVAATPFAPTVAKPSMPVAPTPSAPTVAAPPLGPRLLAGLQRFPGPVLLVISPGDLTAMEFLDLAGSSRAWRTLMRSPRITRRDLPGADHTFSSRAWRDQVAEWTGQWLHTW